MRRTQSERRRGLKRSQDNPERNAHYAFIDELLKQEPTLYSRELADGVFLEFGHKYTTAEIEHILLRVLNLTSGLLERRAGERNEALRNLWRQMTCENMVRYPAHMYLFIDETHLAEEETLRRNGRKPRGQRAWRRNRKRTSTRPVF